jgi:hypothetical protein
MPTDFNDAIISSWLEAFPDDLATVTALLEFMDENRKQGQSARFQA